MSPSFPVVEILKFAVNDAFKQDPSVLNEFLDLLIQAPGVTDAWHGPEVQDNTNHYVVIKWAFREAGNDYASVIAALAKAYKEVVYVHFTHFDAPVDNALGAPITELAVVDVKETVDLDLFRQSSDALIAKLYTTLPNEVIPGDRGTVEEKPRKFMICIGWQSLERFASQIQSNPELVELLTKARELVDFDLKHAKLAKYATN